MLKKRLVLKKKQFLQTYLKKNFHFHFKIEFDNSKKYLLKKITMVYP